MIWLPILYNYIIAASFICVPIMAMYKRTRKFFAVPLVVGVALNLVTESIPLNLFEKNEQEDLTVMTFNMNSAGDYFKSAYRNPREFVDFVTSQNADVVVLEECYAMYCEDAFHKLMINQYPYVNIQHNGCPNWVYSKYPLGKMEEIKMAEGEEPKFVEALDKYIHKIVHERRNVTGMYVYTPKDSLYLIACHLTSNGYDLIRTTMGKDDSWMEGLPRYTDALKVASDERCKEADAIAKRVSMLRNNGSKVIVAGDINDVAGSRSIRTIQKDGLLKNGWWEKGCGFGFTFHGLEPALFRLDHVFHTDNIKLNGIKVVKQNFSDHEPIVAYFDIE